ARHLAARPDPAHLARGPQNAVLELVAVRPAFRLGGADRGVIGIGIVPEEPDLGEPLRAVPQVRAGRNAVDLVHPFRVERLAGVEVDVEMAFLGGSQREAVALLRLAQRRFHALASIDVRERAHHAERAAVRVAHAYAAALDPAVFA